MMKFDRSMRVEIGTKLFNMVMQKVAGSGEMSLEGEPHKIVGADRLERTNFVEIKLLKI